MGPRPNPEDARPVRTNRFSNWGTYRYHVHNYDDSGDNTSTLAASGASVAVYYNDATTTFNVRNTAGDLWTVFDFDNSSGITAIDTMGSEANPGNVDNH